MSLLLMDDGGSVRPPIQQQPRIAPPWDQSDEFGQVYTTPPPEFQPANCPYFLEADFNGVTLTGEWTGNPLADGGVRMVSGPWSGLWVPFLVGANSSPPTMLMTPMLPLYPVDVQTAALTEHCWRGYRDCVIAQDPWNGPENGYQGSTAKTTDWARFIQSWGFRVVLWRGGRPPVGDPYFQALLNAHAVDFYIAGKEVDGQMIAEEYPPVLNAAIADCGGGVPIGAHFTANYPVGFPGDTFLAGGATGSWADYDGKVHLMWQADPYQSAGHQGAMQFYARQRVNLGLIGGDGRPAPNSRVYAYEIMATAELYGQCTELYGKLRSLELCYCPAGMPGIGMISGAGNGLSTDAGWPVLR